MIKVKSLRQRSTLLLIYCVLLGWNTPILSSAELRIPAFTAYVSPNSQAARVSENLGISRWDDPAQSINWYGKFEKLGEIVVKVELNLQQGIISKLRLSFGNQSREASVASSASETVLTADFGSFQVNAAGYHRFQLDSLNELGAPAGDIKTLIINGVACENAHFNLKERRNAASVHLMYPVPDGIEVESFYSEVTAIEDPTTTFYMACGWHRGYFGMQVNNPTERRIIFSVWDSGDEAVDRKKVDDANQVKLIDKGEGVYSGDFGNEGTGGHSHLKVLWKTGEKQRFVVFAEPIETTFTIFSGYWFHPETQKWMLISSWKAPKEGGWLKRPHGFSENFGGSNGNLLRKVLFGNQWIRTSDGKWMELTKAKFSHDPTGKSDRLDRFMGVQNGEFFLSHGGFVDGFTKFGEEFTRDPLGVPPSIPSH